MAATLVTGANGFIGRHVVRALRAADQDVLALEHRWDSADQLRDMVGHASVTACIHLGWYAAPKNYLTDVDGNLRALGNGVDLMRLLAELKCAHLVVAGSCAEYAPEDRPLLEGDLVAPWSVYGAAKAALHMLLESSLRRPELRLSWARLFNITGPGEHPDRLLPSTIEKLSRGAEVSLSPGGQVRDFLDVRDVARALVHLSLTHHEGTINVCSGRGVTLREMLELAATRIGAPHELLLFGDRDYTPDDSMVVLGDSGRLRATGWSPKFALVESIDALADHVRGAP